MNERGTKMSQTAQQPMDRTVFTLRVVAWFLVGLLASAALVVVIPPLDAVLLLSLVVVTVWFRLREGHFGPRLAATLFGAIAFSTYTLIWVLFLRT
jgi:hypothetical protein